MAAARSRENLTGYLLIAPFVAFFAVFLLGPFFYSFWLSLHSTSIYSDWYDRVASMDFVGFRNYRDLLLHSKEFWWSLIVTLYYAVLTIPAMIAFSLLLAILLNSPLVCFKGLFRTGFFVPQVVDLLVIGIIWGLLFSRGSGAIDRLIRDTLGDLSPQVRSGICLGVGWLLAGAGGWALNQWVSAKTAYQQRWRSLAAPILVWAGLTLLLALPLTLLAIFIDHAVVQQFFGTGEGSAGKGLLDIPLTLMPVVALIMVLKGCGLGMILFLTTIQQIPKTIYEAAEVDGATASQRAFLITLPLVRPIVLFLSITGLMATLNAFTEIYAITIDRGGPPTEFLGETVQAGKLTGYLLWVNFREYQYGNAAALSFLLMIVALLISLVNLKFLGGRADE